MFMLKEILRKQKHRAGAMLHKVRYSKNFLSALQGYYSLFDKEGGIRKYNKMQIKSYKDYTKNYEDAKNLCVGNFEAHERYPYEDFLLEEYKGKKDSALDFACGMGRMMNRMFAEFQVVDGVDLSRENIKYAEKYLHEKGIDSKRYTLFQSDGKGVNGINKKYNFIYSTIALQHISVYTIRRKIFSDLFDLMEDGGQGCFQMGFGYDNGVHWFDNNFTARSTNGGSDVCIPNNDHLESIAEDFKSIGYSNIKFNFHISPHPEWGDKYHPIWLFISLSK